MRSAGAERVGKRFSQREIKGRWGGWQGVRVVDTACLFRQWPTNSRITIIGRSESSRTVCLLSVPVELRCPLPGRRMRPRINRATGLGGGGRRGTSLTEGCVLFLEYLICRANHGYFISRLGRALMGSSGSGTLSDYSGQPKTGSGSGSSGGSSGSDKCGEAFTASLEDVASHDYYMNHGSVPAAGTQLTIELRSRLVAVAGTEAVGSLPTRLNYLARCLQNGFTCTGVVTASSNGANPQIQADFVAG